MKEKCQACGEKYGLADDRLPVIFPCLCRLCKGCALQEEAKAQHQPLEAHPKRKGKEPANHRPTPCLTCGKGCAVRVAELLLDVATLQGLDAAHAGAHAGPAHAPPPCDVCEEDEATMHCGDCAKNKYFCDGCFASAHKSSKKQGHSAVPIKEHMSSERSVAAWAGGGGSGRSGGPAGFLMCPKHPGKPLELFCYTCNILVCALCILQHDRHSLKHISGVTGEHRGEVETAIDATTASKVAVNGAIKNLYGLIKTVEENELQAIREIDDKFKPLEQAVSKRKASLKEAVKVGTRRKKDTIETRITTLEDNETCAGAAVSLASETLQAG